jgi:ABC-type branched-subunit amino acid transport system substrate-binding protein
VPHVRRTPLALVIALGLIVASFATVTSAVAADSSTTGASEIGVTAKTINIAAIDDVDNSLAPNAFKPIVDGVQAGVKYVNANGGVAGRTLKLDFIDSHLNPNDTRNAIITACGQDLSMVGTATALFTGLEDLTGCKDQAGQATGLPDIGSIVLGTAQACAPTSYPVIPSMIDCSTVGKNPQTYRTNQGVFKYLSKQHKGDLKGPFIKSSDSPDAARSTDSLADAAKNAGIDVTGMPSLSNASPQSAFTPVVTAMKNDGSNWSDNGLTTPGAVLLRQEAALQGIASDSVVWQCTSACYDQKGMAAAGDAMNGEYVDLGFLPFAEAKTNKTLAGYLKYIGKDNASAFGVYGFEAVLAFKEAADAANKSADGLTRASLLTALKGIHSFNAGGMTGTVDIGGKVPSSCFMVVQWNSGKFDRIYPKKAGTFDCTESNRYTYQTDLTTP